MVKQDYIITYTFAFKLKFAHILCAFEPKFAHTLCANRAFFQCNASGTPSRPNLQLIQMVPPGGTVKLFGNHLSSYCTYRYTELCEPFMILAMSFEALIQSPCHPVIRPLRFKHPAARMSFIQTVVELS